MEIFLHSVSTSFFSILGLIAQVVHFTEIVNFGINDKYNL